MKRLNRRGSAIIEYTVILAFIASVATSFFYEDNFKDPIVHITNRVIALLGGNTNVLKGNSVGLAHAALIGNTANQASKDYDNRVAIVGQGSTLGNDSLIELESNQDYEVVVDINKLSNAGLDPNYFSVCLFLWENNSSAPKASLDSRDMNLSNSTTYANRTKDFGSYKDSTVTSKLSDDKATMTYSFSTKDNAYFGMNLVYTKDEKSEQNKAYLEQISNNYQDYVTLQKKTN